MVNRTEKEERRDNELRKKYPYSKPFVGNGRAKLYNAAHGTNFYDDAALDRAMALRNKTQEGA